MSKPFLALLRIFLLFLVFAAVVGGLWYVAQTFSTVSFPPEEHACTMEARLCPDGSAVGRTGPNCEFAPCPTATPPSGARGKRCAGSFDAACGDGYVCIQECGPPVVREGDSPPPYYCETETAAKQPRMCPICLAEDTMIAAPSGAVRVQDVRAGDIVWSVDESGRNVKSAVLRVVRVSVPIGHRVAHLVLEDGREVWVSPNHPLIDGRLAGEIQQGDAYDGARIQTAELIPYAGFATYDLLPDSGTGYYFANDIPLMSTLAPL